MARILRRSWKGAYDLSIMAVAESIGRGAVWLTVFLFPFFLTAEEFGLVALLVSFEGFLSGVVLMGQDRAILWEGSKLSGRPEDTTSAAWSIMFRAWIVAMLLGWVVISITGKHLFSVPMWPHMAVLGVAVLLSCTNRLVLASQRILEENYAFATNRSLVGVGRFGASVGLGLLTASSLAFPLGAIVGTVIGGAWSWGRIELKRVLSTLSSRRETLFRYGWPLAIHMTAMSALIFVDRWVIGSQLGPEAVGAYTWYYMLGASVVFLYSAVAVYFEPQIYHSSNLRGGSVEQPETIFLGLTMAGSGIYGLAGALLGPLLATLAPASISEETEVTRLVLIAHWIQPLYLCSTYVLSASGKTTRVAVISLGTLVLTIVANVLLVPAMGLVGGAWATLLSFAVLASLSVFYVHRHARVRFNCVFLGTYGTILVCTAAYGKSVLSFGLFSSVFMLVGIAIVLRKQTFFRAMGQ